MEQFQVLFYHLLIILAPPLQYSYDDVSQAGGGGEYEVQVGFGWTNGMLLDIMSTIDCF